MGVEPKIGGKITPKMDGENNGFNPMNKWMIWWVNTIFLVQHPYLLSSSVGGKKNDRSMT